MNYQELPALPPFDRLISCVWFLTGRGDTYSPQPVVPDGRLELLVHLGDPFTQVGPGASSRPQESVLVAGQLTGPIQLQPGAWIDVVGVRLTPLGAHAILRLPLNEITNRIVSLHEVHRRLAQDLVGAAQDVRSREDRSRAIMSLLWSRVSGAIDDGMHHATRSLATGYQGSLSQLARQCGVSLRTLERGFPRQVGLGPKEYQRVVRFRRSFRLLQDDTDGGARVAAAVGYYDQAHLIRDFKRFAGATPRRFFRLAPVLAEVFLTAS